MKTPVLLILLVFAKLSFSQLDSVVTFYDDTIPKVKLLSDGARETYYKSGELLNWSARNRDSCLDQRIPYKVDYYRSGNRMTEYYLLPNNKVALVGYEDVKDSPKTAGRMYNNESTFNYVNDRLVEITSERRKIEVEAPYMPSADPNNPSPRKVTYIYADEDYPEIGSSHYRMKKTVKGRSVAKGHFEYFELQNGFIYYYDQKGKLELTEKVVNGEIQYNPKVVFEQSELERIVIAYYDRNFNGYAESREVNKVDWFKLDLHDTILNQFKWDEIFLFPNLKKIVVNDRIYEMGDYSNEKELRESVINKRGKQIEFQGINENLSPDIKAKPNYIEFPDSSATFIGGRQALNKWLRANVKYPETAKNVGEQGTVYLEFLVMTDGSISNLEVVRGVSAKIDREAKRVGELMPNWKPAIHKGEAVISKNRIPIQFRLH